MMMIITMTIIMIITIIIIVIGSQFSGFFKFPLGSH